MSQLVLCKVSDRPMCFSNMVTHNTMRNMLSCAVQIADRLEHAVTAALDGGYRTGDLMSSGMKQVGCSELGDIIVKLINDAKH